MPTMMACKSRSPKGQHQGCVQHCPGRVDLPRILGLSALGVLIFYIDILIVTKARIRFKSIILINLVSLENVSCTEIRLKWQQNILDGAVSLLNASKCRSRP